MATQFLRYSCVLLPFALIWMALFFDWIPILRISPGVRELVNYAPIYAVFTLGCYAVFAVGYGVATFNDCEDAAKELRGEIEVARVELARKGFTF